MSAETWIRIDLARQRLALQRGQVAVREFFVSTSRLGPGEEQGSNKTPRGRHYVRAKIGKGAALGTVFRGRRPTGEVYVPELARREPGRDWILTRILWLCGLEPGRNRLGNVDSMRRYIYIHGTPDSEPVGTARSHGCIRMRNLDVVWLFDAVEVGTPVHIE
jgi:L,D-transpeptidase YbiS